MLRSGWKPLTALQRAAWNSHGAHEACSCSEHASTSMQAMGAACSFQWAPWVTTMLPLRHMASLAAPMLQRDDSTQSCASASHQHRHEHGPQCSCSHGHPQLVESAHHSLHHAHGAHVQPPAPSFAASAASSSSSSTTTSQPGPASSAAASSQPSQAQPAPAQPRTDLPITSALNASTAGGYMTGVTTLSSGQGFKKTFYKRKLPTPPAIEFASAEGRALFAEALAAGHMAGFFKLMEQFSTQDEPAFCGLASLAMVLNALAIDPRRTWKGAWRWFHEQMLDCCRPLDDVKREGITLSQAACLSRCNGARVDLHRHGTFSLEQLRDAVRAACASGEEHLVVSYSRRTFLQTGDGHFSPVGGYHPGRDLVLILDVARFKYPPHWVPLPMLYDAMSHHDPVTKQPRGYLRMAPQPLLDSVLLTLDVRSGAWHAANDYVRGGALRTAQEAGRAGSSPEAVLRAVVSGMPLASADAFIMVREQTSPLTHTHASDGSESDGSSQDHASSSSSSGRGGDSGAASSGFVDAVGSEKCVPVAARQQLLVELHATPLFQVVKPLVDALLGAGQPVSPALPAAPPPPRFQHHHQQGQDAGALACSDAQCATSASGRYNYLAEKVCMLLMLRRPEEWGVAWPSDAAAAQWAGLMSAAGMSIVEAELAFLREQLGHMDEVLEAGGSLDATCGEGCSQKLDCAAHGHA